MTNSLFTIVLTNYNNEQYIQIALMSIFNQTYNNIQLIITDDSSENFDLEKIKKIIAKYKKKNIKSVKFVINKKNIGTVKTLNKALKKVDGEYVLFFASDDKLADKNVVSHFVELFNKTGKNIITSQWKICDENLNFKSNYIKKRSAKKYNKNINKQYFRLCQSNIYGSGSTCYRKIIFEKYGPFNEKYKYLEDWPFWLRMMKENETIYSEDFNGLFHRRGGVSQKEETNSLTKKFYHEMLNTYEYEIIPNLSKFSILKKVKILRSFEFHINNYSHKINTSTYKKQLSKYIKKNNILRYMWIIDKIRPHIIEKIVILLKYNKIVPITAIISLLIYILFINNILVDKNLLLLSYILNYEIIYLLLVVTKTILNIRK
ncbi:MAG: glycosyltransferase [bacterium]|nr:glycosyltransferase [bacterium]